MPYTILSAQPSLESLTTYVEFFLPFCRSIMGNNPTVCCSTEKPSPVPHIDIYIISPKSCQHEGAIYEQLYAHTLDLRAAGPEDQSNLIEPMERMCNIASRTSEYSSSCNLSPKFSRMKFIYRSTVSIQVSRLFSSGTHLLYVV